jgi:HSP20 family protein
MAQEIKKPEVGGTPATRYRDPFAEMRSEMDRLFDNFLGRGFFGRSGLPTVQAPTVAAPDVDIRENDKELVIEAEMPGLDEKDINVSLRDGVLTLKGEKKSQREEKKDTYHVMERNYGAFQRSFQLPETIDEERINASFDKGVLRIAIPKRPEAVKAERKIPIGKA